MKRVRFVLAIVGLSFADFFMNAQSPSPGDVLQIAERAYVYAYPMVLLQETMRELPGSVLTSRC